MQGRVPKTIDDSMKTAGVDVAKGWLDLAVEGERVVSRHANTAAGVAALIAGLRTAGVGRVGLEASGGYERELCRQLTAAGLECLLLQPVEVRAYALATRRRAKTDSLDARLICDYARHHGRAGRPLSDLHLALAQALLLVEQVEEDVVRAKTRLESLEPGEARRKAERWLRQLERRREGERLLLLARLRQDEELARRFALLISIQGIGERTALTLLIRMPELGSITREEAAALAGLAPFDQQSGLKRGQAHIRHGRAKPRRALYAAALPAAYRWNKAMIDLYARLTSAGKPHKLALVACARKLIVYANAVLARGTPWIPYKAVP